MVKFLNTLAASCECIKHISFMSLSPSRKIKIKIMNDTMRWLAKAALKDTCSSKATTIEKVPRNVFSSQQIPSQKKKKQKTKDHWCSQRKKNHP